MVCHLFQDPVGMSLSAIVVGETGLGEAYTSYVWLPVVLQAQSLSFSRKWVWFHWTQGRPLVTVSAAKSRQHPNKAGYFSGCGLGPELTVKVIFGMEQSHWCQPVVILSQGLEGSEVRWEQCDLGMCLVWRHCFLIPVMFLYTHLIICLFLKHSFRDYSVSGALPETRATKRRPHINSIFRCYRWYENTDYCTRYSLGIKQVEVGGEKFQKSLYRCDHNWRNGNKRLEFLFPAMWKSLSLS